MQNPLKIIVIALFLICLVDMPPLNYLVIRYLIVGVFAVLAILGILAKKNTETFTYIILIILFQPLFKFNFSRDMWTILDIVTAAVILTSMILPRKPGEPVEE